MALQNVIFHETDERKWLQGCSCWPLGNENAGKRKNSARKEGTELEKGYV